MRKAKNVYRFTARGWNGTRIMSKVYISAFHCNNAADGHSDVIFYKGAINWTQEESIYNKNTIGETK